ncbi:hypothetical protein C0992_001331 [Termitomyces sp. T32_za158]|nr:hypothetical protein C0992_001331 [Termitomyces sp. T32_za158]
MTPRLPALSPPMTVRSSACPQTPPAKCPPRQKYDDGAPSSSSTNAPPTPPPHTTRPRTDHPGAAGAPGPSLRKDQCTSKQRKEITHPGSPNMPWQPHAIATCTGRTLTHLPGANPKPTPPPPALKEL